MKVNDTSAISLTGMPVDLDTTFKKQTNRMILDIFINADVEVMLGINKRTNQLFTVKQLLESDFGRYYIKSTFLSGKAKNLNSAERIYIKEILSLVVKKNFDWREKG